jgi:glycosyltransferase involved in cell wall biosynthesis
MHVGLPLKIWRDRVDVFHATGFSAPLAIPCRSVMTVLDLTFVKHPEWFAHRWFYFYTTRTLPILVRRANRIVTISQCSKRDLMEHYGCAAERIVVIPPAVDHDLFHANHDSAAIRGMRERFRLRRRYVLSVGTLEARKNLTRLVESFAMLRSGMSDDCELVLVGERGWQCDEIFEAVAALGLKDRVRFLGYVPELELPLLYQAAELFVYPSLYEGFGVPILEAMACGCPVVCSNRSAMPEVIGEAGILVGPEDRHQIAEAMGRVLSGPSLAETLRARGLEQAQRFRWDDSAKRLLEVYQECASSDAR